MGGWTQLRDASWHRIESAFGLQASSQRTPPIRPMVDDPPPAPRKISLGYRNQQQQIRRENLKPRKLTYEPENQRRVEPWDKDSGIAVWATTSSALLAEDADKENRPENDDTMPNSQEEVAKPGRSRLEQWMARLSIYHQPK